MSNTIRIKRRASGNTGAPSSLKNGELAFNEVDDTLYYGKGTSGGNAETIPPIGGKGAFVDRSTGQTVGGIKTFTALLNADGGIAVDTNKFTVAANGNTSILGTLAVDGVTTADGLINADGGIAVSTNKFTVAASDGDTDIAGSLGVSGPTTLAGVSASTLILTTDLAIADGGTGASTAAAARTNLGVDVAGTDNSTNVTLAGTPDYITASGTGNQTLTLNKIDLTTDVDGALPSGNLPTATSTAKGAIELFSDTVQTEGANTVSDTAGKTYGIQLNSAGQAVVNVPWENTQTPVRDVTVDGTALNSAESLDLISGDNITLAESGGDVTITASHRTVQADGVSLGSSETLNLIGGTNVTLSKSGGAITINTSDSTTRAGLGLATTDDVTFGTLELGGSSGSASIKAPAELILDPAAHGNATGTVKIQGNLQVEGTTTTVNSTVVEIADLAIDLAPSATSTAAINGGGFRIGTLSSSEAVVSFQYVSTDTRMVLSSAMKISGGLEDTVIDGGIF